MKLNCIWLKKEIAKYKEINKIDDESEPTEDEIKLHLKLPNPEKISEFKEPLRQWETVENTGIPSWNKDLLPEEEVEKPADWKPPTPPRVDISLISALEEFENESAKPPAYNKIINDKREILEDRKMNDTDEFVLYSGACIVRTTKKGIEQSKKDRENEEREEARQGGGGGFRGGRGRGGGGRGGRGGRGGGDRDARGGGFGSRDNRSFDRSRNLSGRSSPGRNSIKSENIEDWKDRRDRRSSQEDSRPPRRDSYERRPEAGSSSSSTKRSFSPESQSRGRDDRRSSDMERRWSGQDRGGSDGGGYGDRRDGRDIIKERRDSRGYGDE